MCVCVCVCVCCEREKEGLGTASVCCPLSGDYMLFFSILPGLNRLPIDPMSHYYY